MNSSGECAVRRGVGVAVGAARRRLVLLGMIGCSACALTAPPAASTFAAAAADLAAVDAEAAALLAASKAAPADGSRAVAAAAALFAAADLRLQQASVRILDGIAAPDVAAVLAIDDRVEDPERTAILSLCTEALAAAERAQELQPDAVAPRLQTGLNLSLVAWANGPTRSLFAGYGPRLVAAIDAAVATDAEFENGAPLRLSGRFRSRAPWPYGDVPAAVVALQRAVALAPIAVNQLFLGDALYASGDVAAARAAWTAATTAAGDAATRWSNELLHELARRRLAAMATPAGG